MVKRCGALQLIGAMDRNQCEQPQQAQSEGGRERPLRQQQDHAHHIKNQLVMLDVNGSSEETARERRCRPLSEKCVLPICQPPPCTSKFEGSRKGYNRLVGDSLHTDSRQDVKDVVAKSLKIMDDLLILVQADGDLRTDRQK